MQNTAHKTSKYCTDLWRVKNTDVRMFVHKSHKYQAAKWNTLRIKHSGPFSVLFLFSLAHNAMRTMHTKIYITSEGLKSSFTLLCSIFACMTGSVNVFCADFFSFLGWVTHCLTLFLIDIYIGCVTVEHRGTHRSNLVFTHNLSWGHQLTSHVTWAVCGIIFAGL